MNTEPGKHLNSDQAIDQPPTIEPMPDIAGAQLAETVVKSMSVNDSTLEPGFNRLDSRRITADIIAGSIFSSIFSVAGMIGILVTWFAIDRPWIWYLICAGVGVVLMWLWLMALFWPRREYKYASWKLDDVGLEIRKGVLWRHRITVPRARIQHVDVSQGPLQRNFGLAELTIHTAGTQNSSVKLEGLAHPVARGLRDELISKREFGDAV